MRAVIQRVSEANVRVGEDVVGLIGRGLLILLGIEEADTTDDIDWLSNKLLKLRLFDDEAGVMNLSVLDVDAEVLVVSQFTLHASTKKGNRPSYIRAAKPEPAKLMYEQFVSAVTAALGKPVSTGQFQAMMKVMLVNDGPVTIIIDTRNKE